MTEIRLSSSAVLQLQPGSKLQELADLCPSQLMQEVAGLIAKRQVQSSVFIDWFVRAVDTSDDDGVEDLDDLFVSYVAFCRQVEVDLSERLTFPKFGRALSSQGLAAEKSEVGRPNRRGGKLRNWRVVPGPDPSAVQVGRFLDEQCTRTRKSKVRAGLLHSTAPSADRWALRRGLG